MHDIQSFNAYTKGDPKNPAVVLLHGLLGAARNLYRLAQPISEKGFFVLAYDQRGHGHSPHYSLEEYSLESLAKDVFEMMDRFTISKAHLVGHSMGGRVSLTATSIHPSRVLSLTMLDVGTELHKDAFEALKKIIEPLPSGFPSKQAVEAFLAHHSDMLRAFLLSNLRSQSDGTLGWMFDLKGLKESFLKALFHASQLELWRNVSCPLLTARGENSQHFRKEDQNRLLDANSKAEACTIANAGHWVHADNLEGTLNCILNFLLKHR